MCLAANCERYPIIERFLNVPQAERQSVFVVAVAVVAIQKQIQHTVNPLSKGHWMWTLVAAEVPSSDQGLGISTLLLDVSSAAEEKEHAQTDL